MSKTVQVHVPALFYCDHTVNRELPGGELLFDGKQYARVLLDRESYDELLSDARYYATHMLDAGFDGVGLVLSARATVKALERVERP